MDKDKARSIVCEAGFKLVEQGLVARTWGNISLRIDDHFFAITPSGRNYEQLTPDDIVIVSLDDLSYEGHVKPSSEKNLHAAIYNVRDEINAIIHTHQKIASSVAAARKDIPIEDSQMKQMFGDIIHTAPYALPSTKKLAKVTPISLGKSNACLLANHGAICVGKDMEQAFIIAKNLESICQKYIENQFMRYANVDGSFDLKYMHEYYLSKFSKR